MGFIAFIRPLAVGCFALALLGADAGTAGAQPRTLAELQEAAFENRNLVRQYRTDIDISTQQEREMKGAFLPSLDLGYTLNRINHDTILEDTRENDFFQAGVTWNVFAGFRDRYNLQAARHVTCQSRLVLDGIRQDISLNVAEKLLDVYRSMENLKVSRDEIKLYRDRLRQIQLKYRVGVLKKQDVLRVKVELDNALQTERRISSQVESGLNSLSFETGLELGQDDPDFSIFSSLPPMEKMPDTGKNLLARRSDINALKEALEAARMGTLASKGAFYPRVDTSLTYASYTWQDYFFDSLENSGDEVRFQTTVSMNLFDGMKKYARISQARLAEERLRHGIEELTASLETRLENIFLDLAVARDNLEVAKAGIKEAQESLRVTDLGFDQGIVTSSDVLDVIYNLSRARFNLISAYTRVFDNHFRFQRLVEQF